MIGINLPADVDVLGGRACAGAGTKARCRPMWKRAARASDFDFVAHKPFYCLGTQMCRPLPHWSGTGEDRSKHEAGSTTRGWV